MTLTTAKACLRGVLLAMALATSAASAHAAEFEVSIDNFSFSPKQLTVKAGDTVTWVNRDDIPHTVVSASQAALLRLKALDTNDKASFTFTTPGTYAYFCSLHPMMTGSIVVEGGAGL